MTRLKFAERGETVRAREDGIRIGKSTAQFRWFLAGITIGATVGILLGYGAGVLS